MGRIMFALKAVASIAAGQDKDCPYCGDERTDLVQRKHALWQLRRCPKCLLMFRWPKESAESSNRFYQRAYREGRTTDVPDLPELRALLATGFSIQALNYGQRIQTVRSFARGRTILDYGASWGYGVWQFQKAGFQATGLEIGVPRAMYGRQHLGVRIETTAADLGDAGFDIIHTAHVLEHVSDLKSSFADFQRLLKLDGVLVIFVPNAGSQWARTLGTHWGPLIGEKHVNALTAEFFARNLPDYGFNVTCDSSPYDAGLRAIDDNPFLSGEELLVVAQRRN